MNNRNLSRRSGRQAKKHVRHETRAEERTALKELPEDGPASQEKAAQPSLPRVFIYTCTVYKAAAQGFGGTAEQTEP